MPSDTHLDREHARGWVNVQSLGANGDDESDDTGAFAEAVATRKRVFVPAGTYVLDRLVLTGIAGGWNLRGESTTETVLKASPRAAGAFLQVVGSGGQYLKYGKFSDLTIDISGMPDLAASRALYLSKTWGNSFRNVNVLADGSRVSLYVDDGTYTSEWQNCDFNSGGTGRIVVQGAVDLPTTLKFLGCTFAAAAVDKANQIAFYESIVQGALDAYTLSNIAGFVSVGGDHENTGKMYVLGAGLRRMISLGHSNYANGVITGTVPPDSVFFDPPFMFQFTPAFHLSTDGLATQGGALYQGAGVPNNANGNNGDAYLRTDTPAVANQRLYVKSAGAWAGIL